MGSVRAVADALGKSSAQISQWLNASPDSKTGKPRNISAVSARDIEEKLGKPRGWFDKLLTGQGPKGGVGEERGENTAEPALQVAHADEEKTISVLLDQISARIHKASPEVRDEIARLVTRYIENPDAGARIAKAIEALMEETSDDSGAR